MAKATSPSDARHMRLILPGGCARRERERQRRNSSDTQPEANETLPTRPQSMTPSSPTPDNDICGRVHQKESVRLRARVVTWISLLPSPLSCCLIRDSLMRISVCLLFTPAKSSFHTSISDGLRRRSHEQQNIFLISLVFQHKYP